MQVVGLTHSGSISSTGCGQHSNVCGREKGARRSRFPVNGKPGPPPPPSGSQEECLLLKQLYSFSILGKIGMEIPLYRNLN